LIHLVQINPMDLDWQRFVIAVTPEGEMIGCGQIKPHADGSRELASIAVAPAWRKHGVARLIIEYLIAGEPGILYLTCRASLEPFYTRFGFKAIEQQEMPPYFHRISRLMKAFRVLHVVGERLLVMKRKNVEERA
jgi:N-acetylglutamate synthase-like GNAT family acetyltransferase